MLHNVREQRQGMFAFYDLQFFWATVCKTVRPMVLDRCLSVLSISVLSVCPLLSDYLSSLFVTLVYCG